MFGPSRRELARQLERERARNQQREQELLDRIMHLADRPWTLAPALLAEEPEDEQVPVFGSALDYTPEEFVGG